MINLLPNQGKKAIKKEVLRRFLIVIAVLIFIFEIIEFSFLLAVNYSSKSLVNYYQNQLDLTRKAFQRKNLKKLENQASQLNQLLLDFQKEKTKTLSLSEKLRKIIELKPNSIKITSFLFENSPNQNQKTKESRIILYGQSATREQFLSFVEKLKQSPEFNQVESPLSNLLFDKNLDFTLIIKLK